MNLLLTGAWASARAHIAELEARGHRVSFLPQERDPLPCDPARVEGIVCNGLFLHHDLDLFPALRWIHLTSAGLDRIPLNRVQARGIRLYNARGVYSVPMAEFALAGALALCKRLRFFLDRQREGVWQKRRDLLELAGRSVTVLGCGSVGTECAKRFSAMGCPVTGVDLLTREDPAYRAILPMEALDALLPETDILILTLPLTPETGGLLNADRISRLRQGAILINIARGPLAEESALIAALEDGSLGGAVLDVFQTEPLPADNPLWTMENVILTPHNSFVGEGNQARLSRLILDRLREEESR